MTPTQELLAYIAKVRNSTNNTIEMWNLMIDAENRLKALERKAWELENPGKSYYAAPMCPRCGALECLPHIGGCTHNDGLNHGANPYPDHNGGQEPPLG